jgi:hypothetical protein
MTRPQVKDVRISTLAGSGPHNFAFTLTFGFAWYNILFLTPQFADFREFFLEKVIAGACDHVAVPGSAVLPSWLLSWLGMRVSAGLSIPYHAGR